jgi:hypothetical protein
LTNEEIILAWNQECKIERGTTDLIIAFARLIEAKVQEDLRGSIEDSKRLDWLDEHNESHEIRVDVDCYWYISPQFAKSATGYPFIRGAIDAAAIRKGGG